MPSIYWSWMCLDLFEKKTHSNWIWAGGTFFSVWQVQKGSLFAKSLISDYVNKFLCDFLINIKFYDTADSPHKANSPIKSSYHSIIKIYFHSEMI